MNQLRNLSAHEAKRISAKNNHFRYLRFLIFFSKHVSSRSISKVIHTHSKKKFAEWWVAWKCQKKSLEISNKKAFWDIFKQLYIKIFILTQKLVCWVTWKLQKRPLSVRNSKVCFWHFQATQHTQQNNFWVSMNILM